MCAVPAFSCVARTGCQPTRGLGCVPWTLSHILVKTLQEVNPITQIFFSFKDRPRQFKRCVQSQTGSRN